MTERVCSAAACGYEVASFDSGGGFPRECPQCGGDLVAPEVDG